MCLTQSAGIFIGSMVPCHEKRAESIWSLYFQEGMPCCAAWFLNDTLKPLLSEALPVDILQQPSLKAGGPPNTIPLPTGSSIQ